MGILDDLAMGFGLKEKDRDYYDRTAATIGRNQGSAASDKYKKYVGMTGGTPSKSNPSVISSGSAYANAPNYFQKIGPSLSDFRPVPTTGANSDPYDASGNLRPDYKPGSAAQRYKDVGRPQPGTLPHMLTRSPSVLGILASIFGGYKPIAPQEELPSTYKKMSAAQKAPMGFTPEPVETSLLSDYSGIPAGSGIPVGMEAQYSTSPAPLLVGQDVQPEAGPMLRPGGVEPEAFTGQPSDPMFRPGGEFDAFVEKTMAYPEFDDIRDNRDRMMNLFERYKAIKKAKNNAGI